MSTKSVISGRISGMNLANTLAEISSPFLWNPHKCY